MKTHELRESSTFSKAKVDWDKGIIYGVKVLAESSRAAMLAQSIFDSDAALASSTRSDLDGLSNTVQSTIL